MPVTMGMDPSDKWVSLMKKTPPLMVRPRPKYKECRRYQRNQTHAEKDFQQFLNHTKAPKTTKARQWKDGAKQQCQFSLWKFDARQGGSFTAKDNTIATIRRRTDWTYFFLGARPSGECNTNCRRKSSTTTGKNIRQSRWTCAFFDMYSVSLNSNA